LNAFRPPTKVYQSKTNQAKMGENNQLKNQSDESKFKQDQLVIA